MAQFSPIDIASSKLGMTAAAPALRDFLYTGGQNLDPATRAWCADFVNASLREAGLPGTNSGMARSFLNYGTAVDSPQKGDIAVFSRGNPNGSLGHVGFVDSIDANGNVRVLGGNQGADHGVNYSTFPADRVLGFRRPDSSGELPQQASMPAFSWTPGQQQPQQQQVASAQPAPQQQAIPQAAPQAQSAPLATPSFEQIGKMLGLNDVPPIPITPPQNPMMARFGGLYNLRRV